MKATAVLLLGLVILTPAPPESAVAQPAFQLSFRPDAPDPERTVGGFEIFEVHIRNVGDEFETTWIGFDLWIPLPVLSVSTVPTIPFHPLCDFPPRQWCMGDGNCRDVASLGLVGTITMVIRPEDLGSTYRICPGGPSFWSPLPSGEPGFRDCEEQDHPIAFWGANGTPDGDPCITVNARPVAVESANWSTLKGRWR